MDNEILDNMYVELEDIEYDLDAVIDNLKDTIKSIKYHDNLKKVIEGIIETIEAEKFGIVQMKGELEDEIAHQNFIDKREEQKYWDKELG